ncbi:MAG TPA: hypothetical protein VF868_02015 [Bacteroidia bacterium]|jgi:hypothetical protein
MSIQAQPTLDTIRDCLKQKPQLFAKFDGRNSFIENSRARIFGFKLGVSYGKRLHFGLGYNQLFPNSDAFDKILYVPHSYNDLRPVTANLHMYYVSAHAEYTFYKTRHWELSMPLQFGVGKSYYTYRYLGYKEKTEEAFNFIYEPAISIEYKIVRWVGIGADAGYRFMITKDSHLNDNFTSPTYAFKLLIYYGEIFKSIFPKSKLAGKM